MSGAELNKRRISPADLALDHRERLVEEAAERLSQEALGRWLVSIGEPPPQGLLETYHSLRRAVLAGHDTAHLSARLASLDPSPTEVAVPLFERAFFLFGIRRSGNHAVMDWLESHFEPGETVVLNSADLAPYTTHGTNYHVDFGKYADLRHQPGQRVLIVSYENLEPLLFPRSRNGRIAMQSTALILLRDLPNMAASIARSAREAPSFAYRYRLRDFPDLWCRYAHHHLSPPEGWEPLSYNEWVSSPGYRSQLQRRLSLPEIDVSRDRVSPVGGGSSFDGISLNGAARNMAVLQRWEAMQDDPLFQFLLLAEDKALELNQRLFRLALPDLQHWMRRWQSP